MTAAINYADLLQHSPSIRLLMSRQAELMLSFFDWVFRQQGQSAVGQERLQMLLADYLRYRQVEEDAEDADFVVRSQDSYETKAATYLKRWIKQAFLTNYPDERGEAMYELSSHTEKTLQWMESLQKQAFVGTESRFKDIVQRLNELVAYSNEDRAARLDRLNQQKATIEAEINRLQEGEEMDVFDATQVQSRLMDLTRSAKELLSDFKEVEENFKQITRNIYQQHALFGQQKGQILDFTFEALDQLKESDQGKSFYAFWTFLLMQSRQDEWQQMVDQLQTVLQERDIGFSDRFLLRMKSHLYESGKKVYEANDQMAEKLSRIIGEKTLTERHQLKEVIGEVKQLVVTLSDQPTSIPAELSLFMPAKPKFGLPLERPLTASPSEIPEFTQAPVRSSESWESAAGLLHLFEQTPINRDELRRRIQLALRERKQISLHELIQQAGGIDQGLTEVFAYLQVLKDFSTDIDPSVRNKLCFDSEQQKYLEFPQIIISA
jgi:hypothetical protein